MFEQAKPAFRQFRTWLLAKRALLAAISCLGRRTVTGIICAQGKQYTDWCNIYRLFEKDRFDKEKLFAPLRTSVCKALPDNMPVVAVMDDTICRKWGKKTAGASLRRDPTGPHYRPNFVLAQRFVQVSLIAPADGFGSQGRAIPVEFTHAPSARKPNKKSPPEAWEQYKLDQKKLCLSKVGASRIKALRQQLSKSDFSKDKKLIIAVDGGYTNREVLRSIPDNTVIVGRIRKDAKLFRKPTESEGRGRKRIYGERIPTPEEIRQDETIPWQQVKAYGAGSLFTFDVKIVKSLRWETSGSQDLQLVVVRPIGYRPTKGARMLYRDPAYLICTDCGLPTEHLLQAFLWRWEIEVNFREEKTIMGLGQTQVRTEKAVEQTSAFFVAAYAMIHAAANEMKLTCSGIPMPKWRTNNPPRRCTTNQLISRFRAEVWSKAIGTNLTGFNNKTDIKRSILNSDSTLKSAVLYAIQ